QTCALPIFLRWEKESCVSRPHRSLPSHHTSHLSEEHQRRRRRSSLPTNAPSVRPEDHCPHPRYKKPQPLRARLPIVQRRGLRTLQRWLATHHLPAERLLRPPTVLRLRRQKYTRVPADLRPRSSRGSADLRGLTSLDPIRACGSGTHRATCPAGLPLGSSRHGRHRLSGDPQQSCLPRRLEFHLRKLPAQAK